jgi:hypothetical protein
MRSTSGQACVRLTDRTVGLFSVMPNETFSRRHDVLPSFMNWICRCPQRANELSMSDAEQMAHAFTGRGVVRRAGQN